MKRMIKIGNRAIDLESITSVSYDPKGYLLDIPGLNDKRFERKTSELCVSLGCDDLQVFYDEEADRLWQVICQSTDDITPPPAPASVEEPAA